ncbi:hypothetical protein FRB95_001825 [Tulasnella sp. JGI-2019a]|nr:hypothetical protein FRB95_001825 [Tulasnella sp. JGI-2019a]
MTSVKRIRIRRASISTPFEGRGVVEAAIADAERLLHHPSLIQHPTARKEQEVENSTLDAIVAQAKGHLPTHSSHDVTPYSPLAIARERGKERARERGKERARARAHERDINSTAWLRQPTPKHLRLLVTSCKKVGTLPGDHGLELE